MSAVVALAAAAAAFGVVAVRRREARLRCRAVSAELMAGCAHRDGAALRAQLDGFRRRLDTELAASAVVVAAGSVVDEAWASAPSGIDPSSEGGVL
ncbi:hypothetical protein DMH12_15295 [Streptomyces sp. WAC 04229]|uniref:hypothetical protein n=1 Tax=Streptomyces sp. WAC 04229 TaxID=2203206 RepID=UPI000F73DD9D|nr:hypothetical protein [Streptomyces sp. WAC 04229]RSN55582.1 hypothetical protein DMH12_15295 [Streptomyces sp. WAC 04229]